MSASSDAGRVGVWGRSGSGKSSYVKREIGARKRLVIFDPLQEYGPELRIRTVEHVARNSLDQVRQAMIADWRGFRVSYVPPAGKEPAALSALCKLLKAAQQPYKDGARGAQTMTLVVEEMNLCFPVHGGDSKCPGFAELCSRGRHYGIDIIGVSQRVHEVSKRFRGNTTETVVLAQSDKDDAAAAAKMLGRDGVKKVDGLQNLEFLRKGVGPEIQRGKITFPKKAANSPRKPSAPKKRA